MAGLLARSTLRKLHQKGVSCPTGLPAVIEERFEQRSGGISDLVEKEGEGVSERLVGMDTRTGTEQGVWSQRSSRSCAGSS